MLVGTVLRSLTAGAAGTTALNAVTYADMAVRGRAPSQMPEKSVEMLARRTGHDVPGDDQTRRHRLTALGALSGIGTGLAVGIAAELLNPVIRRLPFPLAAVGIGAAAMAGSDVPMARLGLSDPRSWSTTDWLADALPHLAYGAMTAWALRALH